MMLQGKAGKLRSLPTPFLYISSICSSRVISFTINW